MSGLYRKPFRTKSLKLRPAAQPTPEVRTIFPANIFLRNLGASRKALLLCPSRYWLSEVLYPILIRLFITLSKSPFLTVLYLEKATCLVYTLIGSDCFAAPYLSGRIEGVDQSIVEEGRHMAASQRQRRPSPYTKWGGIEEVGNEVSPTVDPQATFFGPRRLSNHHLNSLLKLDHNLK